MHLFKLFYSYFIPHLMCGRMYVRYAVLPTKAVTTGVFWVFEHPLNFRGKLDTQKQITHLLLFMPSTRLEMHRNRFRPGLCPGPHWGSLQRSLRPLAGGEGARRVLPKNPTSSSALRASAIQAMLCRPPTPPENKSQLRPN